jgi:uncharacterized protein
MRIVIPGGSGQVGQVLARHLSSQGHHVTVLSRTRSHASSPWQTIFWDGVAAGGWQDALEGSDVCINLAGRSVNCRYDSANRKAIFDSRVDSTRILGKVIASLARPPAIWLNASTATIYRHELERPNGEFTGILGGHEPGEPDIWNFSIDVARGWEAAFYENPHAAYPQGRASVRDDIQPGFRRRLRRIPLTCSPRARRNCWGRHAVCLLDPRCRLYSRR